MKRRLGSRSAWITAFLCASTSPALAQSVTATASVSAKEPFADKDVPPEPAPAAAEKEAPHDSTAARPDDRRLEAESTLGGGTGLLRLQSADSGGTGTFRLGVIGSYYTGTGFLCTKSTPCALPGQAPVAKSDDVSQFATRVLLSVTPAEFLEAYAALRYQSTSDDLGNPKAIQIVGDTTLGVKGFLPTAPDRIFTFGGSADVALLSSPGGVGLDAANVGLRALGTADLTHGTKVPLRVHLNAGYLFDNSGVLAEDVEKSRERAFANTPVDAATGGVQRITRIERFSHDINRVDNFNTGIGVEGVFPWVRPFAEWTIDVPVNRQDHVCHVRARSAGDECLTHADFSAVPSRVTLGARAYPWVTSWLEGLSVLAAFDIGTGATSTFVEEIRPELPWAFHFGLAYAVDTTHRAAAAPQVVEKVVQTPPPREHYIEGVVTRAGKPDEPVPGAIVRYVGVPRTGMVADDLGKWKSANLPPGEYKFAISADGYRDGECFVTVPSGEEPATPPAGQPGKAPAAAPPAKPQGPEPPVVVGLKCELEPLPKTATITGVVRDADTTMFVPGASVTITDPLGRELSLQTDAEGAFRFGNVPAGKSKIGVEADGYLREVTELTLEPRHDVSTQIALHPRPKTPNVVVTKNEIKLKKEVHFLHGSAEILPDSMAILEEAAEVLRSHPEIAQVEVQGHTDDTGTPEFNLKLSADRANAVRDVLVTNGVDPARLTAHGYGQEKPLVPNTSPKNKAKNRRVQLVIVP